MERVLLISSRLLVEFILDFFYFPIWWYTGGTKRVVISCGEFVAEANSYLAPGLWLKNIFTPMYGQYDWQGRIVSFMMRVANVIFRTVGLLVWIVIVVALFFIWMIFPVFVVWGLVNSL
jgi:hypothetical protein